MYSLKLIYCFYKEIRYAPCTYIHKYVFFRPKNVSFFAISAYWLQDATKNLQLICNFHAFSTLAAGALYSVFREIVRKKDVHDRCVVVLVNGGTCSHARQRDVLLQRVTFNGGLSSMSMNCDVAVR